MIRFIEAGANAFLKHGIASALHLLKILILIKHRAVSSCLHTMKSLRKILQVFFKSEGKEFFIFDYCDTILFL